MRKRTYEYGRHAFEYNFSRDSWFNDEGTVILAEDMPEELETGLMGVMPATTCDDLAHAIMEESLG